MLARLRRGSVRRAPRVSRSMHRRYWLDASKMGAKELRDCRTAGGSELKPNDPAPSRSYAAAQFEAAPESTVEPPVHLAGAHYSWLSVRLPIGVWALPQHA